jgi:hypothetical protein
MALPSERHCPFFFLNVRFYCRHETSNTATVKQRFIPKMFSSVFSVLAKHFLLVIANHESASQQDGRLVNALVLIAQRAHPASLHDEVAPAQRLPDPANGKGAENMAMPHDQDVALDGPVPGLANDGPVVPFAYLANQPIDALDHLGR